MTARPLIVAIDGPAGVGKSTIARQLAERLGVPYLDTGAMYRAVGLKVLTVGVEPEDRAAVLSIAADVELELRPDQGRRGFAVWLDGEPVGERIRSPEVSEATSKISTYRELRDRMVALQRLTAERFGAVIEGRDIGTVVFPDTPHKFFLDARPEVRRERRLAQLARAGAAPSAEQVAADLERRDERDRGRESSPLSVDGSYILLDSSQLTPFQVVERMLKAIAEKG
jgi:cytidylate kinase